ncbi:TPA: hypothetical protein ACJJLB_002183, partial [Neisseria meningitidis]
LEFQCLKNLSEKTKTLPPSFPRKWESRNEKQQEFIGNDRNRTDWIPAFAGMTGCGFVGMTWCRFPCGWIRHSRAGGNPDLRTTAIFKDYLKV